MTKMSILAITQAIVLMHLTMVSSQFMPQQFPFFPQSMMPMSNQSPIQMPHMNPMGGPMSLPMPFSMNQRLPMVAMPQPPKPSERKPHKKRRRVRVESSSGESGSSEVSYRARNKVKHRRKKHHHQVLTPMISYVTKDGYVVYQKKIKKEKAKDWLELNRDGGEYRNGKRSRSD